MRNSILSKPALLALIVLLLTAILSADESKDYDKACKKNTIESYSKFLSKHSESGSEYAAEAKKRLDDFQYNTLTNNLSGESLITGLVSYLKIYPEGMHADDAKKQVDEYRYSEAKTKGTESAYAEFIKQAYSEPLATEAQAALNGIKLYNACKNDYLTSAQEALANHSNVNYTDTVGNTSLIYAVNNNNLELTRLLLEHGALIDACNNMGFNSLMYAIQFGFDDIVQLLLEHGADANAQTVKEGQTALLFAASEGFNDIVALLLAHGAQVNHKMPNGLPALDYTVYRGYYDTVEQLIEGGADVNITIDDSTNTLGTAVESNDYPMVCLLLKHGAQDTSKGASLAYANSHKYSEIAKVLQDAAHKSFDYTTAMNLAYPPVSQPKIPFNTNGLSMNSTGTITAIEGRKVTLDMGKGKLSVYRMRNYTVLKKPLPKGQQTDDKMYEPARMEDFKIGAMVTIQSPMFNERIPMEMRLGAITFGTDYGLQTE